MPLYEYKALTAAGKATKGSVDADSIKTARQRIKKMGLTVTDLKEATEASKAGKAVLSIGNSVSVKDIAFFTRQLASLIKANIPLVDALKALQEQADNPFLKRVVNQVHDDVNEGSSLAKAVSKHPKVFDNISINMIEAGESSGTLGMVLLRLADLKESQMRLRNKVQGAMTYPILMMALSVFLMGAIFIFVIPKFVEIFQSMNKPLPPITKAMIFISDILKSYWFVFIGLIVAAVVAFNRWVSTPQGLKSWDARKLTFPVIGPLLRVVAVTRFASNLGVLLGSGVPILTAMNIARNLVGNVVISQAIDNARANITEGQSIAEPLRRSGEFPPMVITMITIGEKTGELPEMLKNVSETYEEQVKVRIDQLTSLLEPAMIIVMALIVGVIVLAIFVPMMDMTDLKR